MRHALYPQSAAVYATDQNIVKFAAPVFYREEKSNPPFSKQRDDLLKSVQPNASESDSLMSKMPPSPVEAAA